MKIKNTEYKIESCGLHDADDAGRLNGYLLINGKWELISCEALDEATCLRELEDYLSKEIPSDCTHEVTPSCPLVRRAFRMRNGATHIMLFDESQKGYDDYCEYVKAQNAAFVAKQKARKEEVKKALGV